MAEWGWIPSRPLTAHFYVNPTMTNLRRLLVRRLLVCWFPVWWLLVRRLPVWSRLELFVTVDCCGFSAGWIGGVGPGSCRSCKILPQRVSEVLAAALGKRVLRRWVRQRELGSCRIQAASGSPSGCLNPLVLPRPQNPALPNPMRGSRRFVQAIPGRRNNQQF